jgi:hypothetical protein
MELVCSLPCSQEPATDSYPEADEFSPKNSSNSEALCTIS